MNSELGEDTATGYRNPAALATPGARHQRTSANQPVLSIRGAVPKEEDRAFIAEALHDIRLFMHEHEIPPAGPPFSICEPRGSYLEIEAGWPTSTQALGTSRIHSGSLPRSLAGHGAVRH